MMSLSHLHDSLTVFPASSLGSAIVAIHGRASKIRKIKQPAMVFLETNRFIRAYLFSGKRVIVSQIFKRMWPINEGRSGATRAVSVGRLQVFGLEIQAGAYGSFLVFTLCGDRAVHHISPKAEQGHAVWHF
jgi:hypothetical protein